MVVRWVRIWHNRSSVAGSFSACIVSIFLVRHTAPDIKPGIVYGDSNVPVHEEEFARVMPDISAALPSAALVISSPLSRCRRLADFLQIASGEREVRVDDRLRERALGRWQGGTWEDIPTEEMAALRANYLDYPAPGGESIRALRDRVVAAFEDAWSAALGRPLVLVCHAGPIACIIAHWRGDLLKPGLRPTAGCGDVLRLNGGSVRSVSFLRRASPVDGRDDDVI
jgi:alpha-ribazole phosphatase